MIDAHQKAEEPKEAMMQKAILSHLKSVLIMLKTHIKVIHPILKSAITITTCQHQEILT